MIERLKRLNPGLKLMTTQDERFKVYGRVIEDMNFKAAIEFLNDKTEIPQEGNVYVSSLRDLEEIIDKQHIERKIYGEMICQAGYCNGRNQKLNGVEFHKGNEVIIACTDFVLLLGHIYHIKENKYDSRLVEGVYVKKGTAIELYSSTLHLSPCRTSDEGFKAIIILPKGTNTPLNGEKEGLLLEKNKWVIIHEDALGLKNKGALIGIEKNIILKY